MSMLSDTYGVCWRELMHFARSKVFMATIMIQPIIWLGLMGNMFQITATLPGFPAPSYLSYMAPGIITMVVLFGGIYGGMSVVWDKRFGFMSKMLAAPISRSSIAIGKMLSTAIRSAFQATIVLGVATVMGAGCVTGIPGMVALILIAMLLCLGFSGLSLAIGATVKTHETLIAIINFLMMPLIFMSNALFPLEFMPSWLMMVATYNPLTYAITPIRTLMLEGWDWMVITPDVTVVAVFVLAMIGIATVQFRRTLA